jgi:FAD/FMN-containing dehydrogenase
MMRELSRQSFVRGVGVATAGLLLGSCRSTTAVDSTTATPASSPAGPTDWAALAATLEGHVTVPSDPGYSAAKASFNAHFANSTPAAVISVKSVDDVRRAMAFGAEHGVTVTARSGGHSYVGASAADRAMVIDLRGLAGEAVADDASGVVTVSAAAGLSSVQTALNARGRAIPTGSCPSVGVSGLTLGGGLGADARRYGLTCDALVSATVALPSGAMVTASPGDHQDLYWALRGGGANLGIVTSMTFRTFSTATRDVVSLSYPQSATAQTIVAWHDWLAAADRDVWSMVDVTVGPDSWRCGVVLATPPGDGVRLAAELSAAVGTSPVDQTSRTLDHMAFVDYFSGGSDAVRPRAFVAGSDVLADVTPAGAESIVAAMSAWPRSLGSATAVIESLGGAVSDVGPSDTAFPWRHDAACVQWYVEPPADAIAAGTNWLAAAHDEVGSNSVGGYVNYIESAMPAARYFGDNLQRLKAIRGTYDPAGLMLSTLVF